MLRTDDRTKVYLDLTHLGRQITGIERVSIQQFEAVEFDDAEVTSIRSRSRVGMVLMQQFYIPLLALLNRHAVFVFPGFPPSFLMTLCRHRVVLYIHDTFLIERPQELSVRAKWYMVPQFKLALRVFQYFLVNSEKTRGDLIRHVKPGAAVRLYRPAVANIFNLNGDTRRNRTDACSPLRLVALGTIEPRKNYTASLRILAELRASTDPLAELHIVGRAGWIEDIEVLSRQPGVRVHGYLDEREIKELMDESDVFLCTSHDEGLGLPLLEAQFAGLAVVAPDRPVFREVLKQSGTLIDTEDAVDAAARIAALIGASGWRRTTTVAAVENVVRWNDIATEDLKFARGIFSRGFAGKRMPSRAARAA